MTSSTQGNENSSENEFERQQFSASEKDKALVTILDHLDFLRGGRPTPQMVDAKSERTQRTVERILSGARRVFTENGYGGLSLRKVAEEAEIAVGNLTYHFPNKQTLIEAMLRDSLARYIKDHLDQFHVGRDSASDILITIIRRNGVLSRKFYRFFFQTWGYAASSEQARETVRELYRPLGKFIFHMVRAANPSLDYIAARRATLQYFSLEEGYKLFVGYGPTNEDAAITAEKDIEELVREIVGLPQ
ncbi:TetR/AcrR family transcriptional regulator [Hyphococcus sp. DH-69]|uniref:TetR/AcrR family transcriptional regulator n=1 Tax=Hyphococcus formosus TaxID=3143534 RepID=UPI00398B29E6